DHDDHVAVLAGGDVVECLPAHAAGEGAVTDDGDDLAFAASGELEGLRHAVGVGQGGGGVGGLGPVVLGLAAGGVAGDAAPLTQGVEGVGPSGEDLVHVGLVRGVEDDRVLGG